jgi:hypothetical protein
VRKMVINCRGNPPWLPILRAATGGRPYNILLGSGLSGLGLWVGTLPLQPALGQAPSPKRMEGKGAEQ